MATRIAVCNYYFRRCLLNIFKGKTAAVCAVTAVIICAAFYFSASDAIPSVFSVSAAVLIFVSFIIFKQRKISGYRFFTSAVYVLTVLCLCVRCFMISSEEKRISDTFGSTDYIECKVTRVGYSSEYLCEFGVDCEIDGGRTAGILLCSFGCGLNEGDTVRVTGCTVSGTVNEGYGDPKIRGEYVKIECDDEKKISVLHVSGHSAGNKLRRMRNEFSSVLDYYVGSDGGGLASRLLLRTDTVDKVTERDCRRAGISHVLCVSGMHLSVLSGLCDKLLLRLGLGRKKRMTVITILLTAYIAMIGFPVSAVRAAVNVYMYYVGYVTGALSGGFNSLCISVIVLLISDPYTVADPGFVLSVCATLGISTLSYQYRVFILSLRKRRHGVIFVLNDPLARKKKHNRFLFFEKIPDYIIGGIVSWAAVNALSALPISLLYGEISLMSIPSGFFFPPLSIVIIVLSVLILITSPLPFVPDMLGYYTGILCKVFTATAGRISAMKNAVVPMTSTAVRCVLAAVTVAMAVMFAVKLKRKFLISVPPVIGALSIAVILSLQSVPDGCVGVRLLSEKSGEWISVRSGREAVICDISSGASGPLRVLSDRLRTEGVTEIRALVLTHCHAKHANALRSCAGRYYIREVWLPEPQTPSDAGNAISLICLCSEYGIKCRMYGKEEKLTVFGNTELTCSLIGRIKRSDHPTGWLCIRRGEKELLYLARSSWEADEFRISQGMFPDYVIYGSHGPKPKKFSRTGLFGNKTTVFTDEDTMFYSLSREKSGFDRLCEGKVCIAKEYSVKLKD